MYLNTEAIAVLRKWQSSHHTKEDLVFRNARGLRFTHVKTSWSRLLNMADIENFRWHDMRHTFASKLVMKGVDLNTVREFLGHTDIKMTQRYAHLAPEHKARAVELLVPSA